MPQHSVEVDDIYSNQYPDVFGDIAELHALMQVPVRQSPTFPSRDRIKLRRSLIDEEVNLELIPALAAAQSLPDIADAICDSIVVLLGTALEFGIPFDDCWREVHRSNMAKVGDDGKPILRADGKFLKPPGWTRPNIKEIIEAAIEEN